MKYMQASISKTRLTKTEFKAAAAVFCIALFFRALYFLFFLQNDPGIFARYGDSSNYVNAAKNMLIYNVLCEQNLNPPYPGIFRTPGYPIFVAVIYFFTGYSDIMVVFVQIIISSLTCVMLYKIASIFSSRIAALLSALFLAADVVSIKSANEIMTETLFTFILLVMVRLFMSFFKEGKARHLAAAAATCAVGTLIRPILLYFFLLVPVILVIYFRKRIRQTALYSIIFVSVFALLVSPWVYRNYKLGYNGFAAVQEVNVYIFKAGWIEANLKGNSDIEHKGFNERFKRVDLILKERGMENTPYNRVKIYKELGTRTIIENPMLALKYQLTYTLKIFTSLGTDRIVTNFTKNFPSAAQESVKLGIGAVYAILLYTAYLLFFIGAIRSFHLKPNDSIAFIFILLSYLAALSGEWGAESRFRTPLIPLILIFSAVGTDKIINFFKNIIRIKNEI